MLFSFLFIGMHYFFHNHSAQEILRFCDSTRIFRSSFLSCSIWQPVFLLLSSLFFFFLYYSFFFLLLSSFFLTKLRPPSNHPTHPKRTSQLDDTSAGPTAANWYQCKSENASAGPTAAKLQCSTSAHRAGTEADTCHWQVSLTCQCQLLAVKVFKLLNCCSMRVIKFHA